MVSTESSLDKQRTKTRVRKSVQQGSGGGAGSDGVRFPSEQKGAYISF